MKKLFGIVVVMLMFSTAFAAAANYAEPGAPVNVNAGASIVEGGGISPTVEYVWILPDHYDETGTQINIVPSGERCDIYACVVVGDEDGRDTIKDVFAEVSHPDGSEKYQMHGYKVAYGSTEYNDCLAGGIAAGLITDDQAHGNTVGVSIDYEVLGQQNWYMYKIPLPMYYHQPNGEYGVDVYVLDESSRVGKDVDPSFTWVANTYLELDFTNVDFGQITPNSDPTVYKKVNGDMDMSTPDAPSLKNEGNTEITVGVEFSEFVGTVQGPTKIIDSFDAQLRNIGNDNYNGIEGEHLFFKANQPVEFKYPIELCRVEKIDFSAHADSGTMPDNYSGTITISATPATVDYFPHTQDMYPVGIDCR